MYMQVAAGDVICFFFTTVLPFGVGANAQASGECNQMGRLMPLLSICALTCCIKGRGGQLLYASSFLVQ